MYTNHHILISRKDYGELGILRAYYPNVPILALSATCPPRVLNSVLDTLQMKSIIQRTFFSVIIQMILMRMMY